MSCGVGHRRGSDLVFLWAWCRLAAAAMIRSLAWELPYARYSPKEQKKKKKLKQISKEAECSFLNHFPIPKQYFLMVLIRRT